MRLTTKGQVTIPIEIREQLGLLPYTEVEFEVDGDAVKIRKASKPAARGRALIDHMRGRATRRLSTEQILALTRR
jgi:AbrB family looped-hinge helix DNA binding protein